MFFFAVKIFSDSSEKLGAIITSKNVLTISLAVSVSSSALSPTIPQKAETGSPLSANLYASSWLF